MAGVIAATPEDPIDPEPIFTALKELAARDPRAAQIVALHYRDGEDVSEIAGKLHLSERTVKRDLKLAKGFVGHFLQRHSPE